MSATSIQTRRFEWPVGLPVVRIREDDHDIDFDDTRSFAAEKWKTAVEALEISAADWQRGREVDTFRGYCQWIKTSIRDSTSAQQRSHLQSLYLLSRPVQGFIQAFEKLVMPEVVEMSVIWALIYLNISYALPSNDKLKQITVWLSSLKRSVEATNQCIQNFVDKNSARTEITDVFEPLLTLLMNLFKFQRTYIPDAVFVKNIAHMKEFVSKDIDEIEEVIRHFRSITLHSRETEKPSGNQLGTFGIPIREKKENPFDRAAFPVDNVPDIRTEHFFGREQVLQHIDSCLGRPDVKKLRTFLIYGLRGVGKTQVALEYAKRTHTKLDAVFWIRCDTSASLRQSFSDIAVKLERSTADQITRFEENQMKVLEWLSKTSKSWLLIYDNAERDQALKSYWPRNAVGSVLLTSRSYYNFEHQERREGETIPVFTSNERRDLLMHLLGLSWQHKHLVGDMEESESKAITELLEHLGGLPLAISQAAKLILDETITPDQSITTFLSNLTTTNKTLPPRTFGHRNEKVHNLNVIFIIALKSVSEDARKLLGVFSLLAPDSIPIDLFLPADQSRLTALLEVAKRDHDGTTPPLDLSRNMEAAFEELKAAGLIRQDNRSFIIHRVIQEAMRYINLEDIQTSFDICTELLHQAFPRQKLGRPLYTAWHKCQLYVQHVVALTKAFSRFHKEKPDLITVSEKYIQLLSSCGWYLWEIADYSECLEMMDVATSVTEDKESLLYSHLVNTIGAASFEQNKLTKARIYYAEARRLRERHLDPDHPQIATILGNAGNVESAEGNYDAASELFERVVRIRETHGENEIISLGTCFLQMGRVSFLRKQTFEATQLYKKAEACFMRKPDLSRTMMAHLHYAQGNLELSRRDIAHAVSQYEKCRDICYAIIPVQPLAAAAFYKLAVCEIERGSQYYDRALVNLEKAYNIATIRSSGEVDGTVARIQWRKTAIMIDNPMTRSEGLKAQEALKLQWQEIAMDLGIQTPADKSDDELFDVLVPGYFR